MNCLNNVRNVTRPPNSSAKTSDAFRAAGPVILKTIALTVTMKMMNSVAISIANVPLLNSAAPLTANAFRAATAVTTTVTVPTDRMKLAVKASPAQMAHSSARVVTAFPDISDAMENAIATWMPLMKQTVHLVIQVIFLLHNFIQLKLYIDSNLFLSI